MSRKTLSTRVAIAWDQGKTKVNRLLGNGPPEAYNTREQTRCFLHEIIEVIIAHLIDDLDALKASSLTCRAWYIVAAPRLHYTFTLREDRPGFPRGKLRPLSKLHELDLFPLVKEIRVEQRPGTNSWFAPRAFGRHSLRYFSAFANVHTMKLQNMQIYQFIPGIERYFEHFSPTLRSITLYDPCCTPRQLSHFFSLFSNLDDIEIERNVARTPETPIPDAMLFPLSFPKLRGRLALYNCSWAETWKHLITSGGSLRFRSMDLRGSACCTPVLLRACAETLDTLRFSATDDSAGNLNLSPLKALRSLQVEAWVASLGDHGPSVVVEVFSTIASPVFSELVVILMGRVAWLPQEVELFRTLRTMHKVKPFKLVFLLEVPDLHRGEGQRELAGALASVTASGLLDFLYSPPTIRTARPQPSQVVFPWL